MISLKELNPHDYPTTSEIDYNLSELLRLLNIVRLRYGKPMIVNSGLRSNAQQQQLIADGKSNAPASKHLIGAAADIHDDGEIKDWVKANVSLMEHLGLYMEDFNSTPTWVHFQFIAPKSGNRFFIP